MKRNMRKILPSMLIAASMIVIMSVSAFAQLVPTNTEWNVSFAADNTMVSDFSTAEMDDKVYGLQPGDYTDIVLNLTNDNEATVDWYMTNDVITSLEDSNQGAAGGAYTYILTFKNTTKNTEKDLYRSDTVGGEEASAAGEGLHEATDALKDWIYLDTFAPGDTGVINLRVMLDGETQGNGYQDTLAELEMNFAVELNEPERGEEEPKKNKKVIRKYKVVRTGDYTDTLPYIFAAAISGVVLLVLAVYSLRERRRQRGGR